MTLRRPLKPASNANIPNCVEVCPVDCFYEGDNMLVIHPDEMHRLRRVASRNARPNAHQAGHRARSGEMARSEYRIRQELAEYHAEKREAPAGRQGFSKAMPGKFEKIFFLRIPARGTKKTVLDIASG